MNFFSNAQKSIKGYIPVLQDEPDEEDDLELGPSATNLEEPDLLGGCFDLTYKQRITGFFMSAATGLFFLFLVSHIHLHIPFFIDFRIPPHHTSAHSSAHCSEYLFRRGTADWRRVKVRNVLSVCQHFSARIEHFFGGHPRAVQAYDGKEAAAVVDCVRRLIGTVHGHRVLASVDFHHSPAHCTAVWISHYVHRELHARRHLVYQFLRLKDGQTVVPMGLLNFNDENYTNRSSPCISK